MTAVNRATLYTYFETGDKPTQAQFANLIDSCLNLATTSAQTITSDVSALGSLNCNSGIYFNAATSGRCLVSVSSNVAGLVNFKLPSDAGTNGYVLQTNGAGKTKWVTAGGGGGSGTVSSGSMNQLAYYPANGTTVAGSNTLLSSQMPALTGDLTTPGGSLATTLATVNSNVGSFTNANITVNAKGLVIAAANGTAVLMTALGVGCVASLTNFTGSSVAPGGSVTYSAGNLAVAIWNGSSGFGQTGDTISGTWTALQTVPNNWTGLWQRTA